MHSHYHNSLRGVAQPGKAAQGKHALHAHKWDNQTIAEHYFAKTGVYLNRRDNEYLFKCSKERCLLDFSV